jgi:YbbR domain-containing protein
VTAEVKVTQRLRRMLLQNVGLKLFSLMVSVGLFAAVHGSEVGQRSLDVPVVAVLPPESSGKVLVGDIPDNVKVTLSGSRSVLNSINRVDAVQVDIHDAPPSYTFEAQAFGLPTGIAVEVNPPNLRLRWEERAERKVSVRPHFTGSLDPAFELSAKMGTTPPHVKVRGPRSRIEALGEVETEPISLSNLGLGSHRRHVSLAPLPQHVTSSDSIDVVVEFAVEARKEQRRLRKLPVSVLGVTTPVQIRPQNVDVILSAPERTLAELDPDHIVPVVDLTETTPGAGAQPMPVKLRGIDDSVRVIRIEPAEVLVRTK